MGACGPCTSLLLGEPGSSQCELLEHRVGEPWPGLGRPGAEGEVGQAAGRDAGRGVDPEERAAAAEVAERALRVPRTGPVRGLPVAELEAEPPVVRLLASEPWQHADAA